MDIIQIVISIIAIIFAIIDTYSHNEFPTVYKFIFNLYGV